MVKLLTWALASSPVGVDFSASAVVSGSHPEACVVQGRVDGPASALTRLVKRAKFVLYGWNRLA